MEWAKAMQEAFDEFTADECVSEITAKRIRDILKEIGPDVIKDTSQFVLASAAFHRCQEESTCEWWKQESGKTLARLLDLKTEATREAFAKTFKQE